jgi:acyl-[acyl-carrier-protein]-phospholipid O-acyltransferase / long-chain-fatty-acid--[acyl-carrier-protein] ligase
MSEGWKRSAVQVENAGETPPDREPRRGSARYSLGFWSLVVTQFQGAFNDNALKFLVIYLVVEMSLPVRERDWLVLVVGALFALPFILFSMTGGFLADRFSKRSVTIGTKWMELGVMLFTLGALARGNLKLEAAGVFLLSSQAAVFGPSKYGLLPELLPEKDLSWGNGVIELGTFLAAISATVASGFLAYHFRGQQSRSGAVLIGCTLAGLATSFGISRVPAANPARMFNRNPLGDLGEQIRTIRSDRVLCWSVVGNFYLWFLAALLQFTIVIYGHDILRIDERHISYLQAAVAVGIGLGSLVAGYLSDAKIEYGLIPAGAVGMAIFGFLSASHGISLERAAAYLGLLGFFGGFYAVPLNALIQHRPDPARKGGVIAAANLISFVGVFAAAGVYFALSEGLRLRADEIFFAGACMTLAAALYAVVFLPDSVVRLVMWILTHSVYRVHVEGRDNIPERGGALFVVNDVTLLDVIFLSAATDRPIRFVTERKPFARTAPVIRKALRVVQLTDHDKPAEFWGIVPGAFASGEVVCITEKVAGTFLTESAKQERMEEYLRGACSSILAVSVIGEENGPLRSDHGRLCIAPHLHGVVTVRFCAALTSREDPGFAEALNLLRTAPTLHSSGSSD